MKKIFSVLLAIALLILSTVFITVSAAENSVSVSFLDLKYDVYDINFDGKEDAGDLATMRSILLDVEYKYDLENIPTEKKAEKADVNKDEKVNILDLVHLKNHLAGANN